MVVETTNNTHRKTRMKLNPLLIAVAVTGFLTFLVGRHLDNPMVIAGIIAHFFAFLALVRHIAKSRPSTGVDQ